MQNPSCGYLELILGPMFSGKTSKLLEIQKQYQICNIKVIVVNHSSDTRYDQKLLSTHDMKQIPCVQCNLLSDIIKNNIDDLKSPHQLAILINEGQFFPDLYHTVSEIITNYKKHVYIAGLDGDFKREKFGRILDLIPLSDKVYKLHSLCIECKNGTKAIFSYRIDTSISQQHLVGTAESYLPLCRSCYDNRSCHDKNV